MSGTGRILQSAASFEGDLDVGIEAGTSDGSRIGMRTKVTGRRLGPY